MTKQVAVIILNYFGFNDTVKCVESVQQVLRSEIFLVDNSADFNEKKKILRAFKNTRNIHMLFPNENLGFAAGVNLAIQKALKIDFKRFLLLNNDTVLLANAKSKLLGAYDEDSNALIAPTINWGGQLNRGYYYHKYLGFILQNNSLKRNHWLYFLSGCALAFNKSFLDKVGLFNEKFFMYGEDVELCHRAQEKQIPIILLDDELVQHTGSQSAKMASFFYEYHMLRSHFLLCFFLFNNPVKTAAAILGKSVTLLIRSFFRSVQYRSLAPLSALIIAPFPLKIRPNRKKIDQ